MFQPISINWAAVGLTVVASFLVGSILYARPVMGDRWMRGVGLTPERITKEGMVRGMVASIALSVILGLGFAAFRDWTGATGLVEGLRLGVYAWVAFAVPLTVHQVYEGRPAGIAVLYATHHLLEFLAVGAIHGVLT